MTVLDEVETHELAGHTVRAFSVGGLETCIDLPKLGVAFDVGRCPHWIVRRKTILFTHAHIDHMGGVASHAASRGLLHMPAPVYVVPPATAPAFEALLDAWRRLDGSVLDHELVALGPGQELALGRELVVRPFRTYHTAPSQGYGLWSVKQKLRPEFQGLDSREIARLRVDEGVEVTMETRTPEVVFVGDTRIDVVDREEAVRRARLLVLEVTFLDDRVPVESAREMGHVHLDEVIERADAFENEALLFTHFSARYTAAEIAALLAERLPAGLRERVTALRGAHVR
jgi:ribonuclease Z